MASFMAALALEVAAWVVAWILSWRLLLLSEKRREEGEDGEEEDDGNFTGDWDPFRVEKSEQAIVVCPVEREETVDRPPWDARVESTELCIKDKLEMDLAAERDVDNASVVCVEPRTDLKGRPELYMFTDVFGDVGVLCAASDLSTTEPLAEACTGEVLEV
jgi:hypothetical protein